MTAPRIIAGRLKNRRVKVPEGNLIRPTAERMREALFSILGAEIEGARFLDLFAGSGAIGLEALSRGASTATFVEQDPAALAALRDTIRRLGVEREARVIGRDARNLGHAHDVFDLVYADPPYRSGLHATTLDGLRQGGWIDGNSLCVTERAAEEEVASCAGFMLVDDRRYGAGCVSFYRLI